MTSVVIMAAIMSVAIVEGVAVCSLLEMYRNFLIACCLLCYIKYINIYYASYDNEQLVLVTAFCVWYCILGIQSYHKKL
jgi:hypothetical protein